LLFFNIFQFMLQGLPHLCKYMPEAKDARRLIPDPDNEPDFDAIGRAYPLPHQIVTVPSVAMKRSLDVSWLAHQVQLPPTQMQRLQHTMDISQARQLVAANQAAANRSAMAAAELQAAQLLGLHGHGHHQPNVNLALSLYLKAQAEGKDQGALNLFKRSF
jgi:hypothetical protein